MNYSQNENMVRATLFRPSGKWYEDVQLDMGGRYTGLLHDQIRAALDEQHPKWKSYVVVVLEPYHEHSHPVMLKSHLDS